MQKIILCLITALLLTQTLYAETCPSLKNLKSNLATTWKAYDSDDNKPLAPERSVQFINNIDQFSLAEWVQEGPRKGAIHCYYSDKNGSMLEAYLAKESYVPQNTKHFWYEVSGSMHCAAGTDACLFDPNTKGQPPTLAKK